MLVIILNLMAFGVFWKSVFEICRITIVSEAKNKRKTMSNRDPRFEDLINAIENAEGKRDTAQDKLDKFNENFADEIKGLGNKIESYTLRTLPGLDKISDDDIRELKAAAQDERKGLLAQQAELLNILKHAETQLVEAQAELKAKKTELKELEDGVGDMSIVVPTLDLSCLDGLPYFDGSVDGAMHILSHLQETPFTPRFLLTCPLFNEVISHVKQLLTGFKGELILSGHMNSLVPLLGIDEQLSRVLELFPYGNVHHKTQTSTILLNDKGKSKQLKPDCLLLTGGEENGRVCFEREDKFSKDKRSEALEQLCAQMHPSLILGNAKFIIGQLACGSVLETGLLLPDGHTWRFLCAHTIDIKKQSHSNGADKVACELLRLSFTIFKLIETLKPDLESAIPRYWTKTNIHRINGGIDTYVIADGTDSVKKRTTFYNTWFQWKSVENSQFISILVQIVSI
eukprot:TRINITY_DN16_c0_g1_i8.p1 TRINITY_DN16_c0_g1~~TRINITY_DN16_c0_g1_i8.p1  ORF type:complete len:457 (-),score=119.42 TRINITY_DN16_c0_g1_i8:660-2030(-)